MLCLTLREINCGVCDMLYVSSQYPKKFANENQYVVTDTDDGISDVVPYSQLLKLVEEKGIQIEGVVGKRIYIQNHDNKPTAEQAKLAIQGVEIHVIGNVIRQIVVRKMERQRPVRIVLSHFGKSIFNKAIIFESRVSNVIFVLDSSFDFRVELFWLTNAGGTGVRIDITQLDNEDADYLYNHVISAAFHSFFFVDNPDRAKVYKEIHTIIRNKGYCDDDDLFDTFNRAEREFVDSKLADILSAGIGDIKLSQSDILNFHELDYWGGAIYSALVHMDDFWLPAYRQLIQPDGSLLPSDSWTREMHSYFSFDRFTDIDNYWILYVFDSNPAFGSMAQRCLHTLRIYVKSYSPFRKCKELYIKVLILVYHALITTVMNHKNRFKEATSKF